MTTMNVLRRAMCAGVVTLAATLQSGLLNAEPAQQPQYGGVLTAIVNPEPPHLNVATQQIAVTQLVAGKVYESLLTYSTKLEPMPSLAKSWEVSDDQLQYTFHLQEGVTWHDGEPFSADDVIFSYENVLSHSPRVRMLMEHVDSIEAPDANTVVFKLKQPYSAFIYAFDIGGGAILPKHLYDVDTEISKNPYNNAPVGTGPFKFKKWERGAYIELVKNENYWREGRPYLDGITYRVIPDAASRRLALEQGTVMQSWLNDLEPFDVVRLEKQPNLQRIRQGYEYWSSVQWLEFNTSKKPLDDKRFRQAFLYALDRDFIVDKIMFGTATASTGPIHRNIRFYDPTIKQYEYDPEKAMALLDEMGLTPGPDGVRATVNYIPSPYGEMMRRIAEYVRQSLSKVGVVVNIQAVDAGAWTSSMGNWDFEIVHNAMFQLGDPAIGVARPYISSNIHKGLPFTNISQYSNPRIDELFEAGSRAPTDEERQRIYSEIQEILAEELPLIWLADTDYSTMLDIRVHDAITTGLGAVDSYADAWISK